MDLPTCPSCKQSVLDEDATDCPFCGAAMKGGSATRAGSAPPARMPAPRSAPPAKLQPAAAPSGAEAKAKPAEGKAAPPKRAAPEDDDPFAVDESIGAKAIPLSPKPAQGKSFEVKCPMCETTGYASQKAAGQQVRCCNPKCLVPVFSAPAPKKAEPPPPPPPPKKPIALYAGIGIFSLIAVGVLVWLSGSLFKAPDSLPPLPPVVTTQTTPQETPEVAADAKKKADARISGKGPAVSPAAALTGQALKRLGELNLSVPSNRKAYCRRLSAIAFIESGDVQGGRDQIEQLMKVGKQNPYEACLPNVILAWQQLATSPEEFKKTVAEAKRLADNLPPRGRYAIDAGIATAAVLVADGQLEEARKLISANQGPPDLKQLAAAYQVVQNNHTYDLDAPLTGRTLGDWLAPLESAVTLILAAHDRWDDAKAWAVQLTDPLARTEATLIWGEEFARHTLAADPAADLTNVVAVADGLPPAAKARLLARLAAVQLTSGNAEAAENLLQQAAQLLAGIAGPVPFKVTGAKSVLDLKLPDGAPLRLAALAAAEIGVVRTQMKQTDAAWSSFQMGLRYLRGTAPGLTFAQQRQSQIEGGGAEKIRGELKSALQLKTDDQVRLHFNQYVSKVKDIRNAAFQRFQRQTELLEVAARLGLVDQVWDEIQKGEARPDVMEREPFLASSAPTVLAEQFKSAGNADARQAVMKAAQPRENSIAPELQVRILAELTRQGIDAGQVTETVKQLNETLSSGTGVHHETSLRLACRLVKAGKSADAIKFVGGLRDTVLREDGLYLIAALASRHGHAADVWKQVGAGLGPMETAALCAGLATGIAHPSSGK